MAGAKVAIAMHSDCGSSSFQRSHTVPEIRIGILESECRVLIIRDNGKNRRYQPVARNDGRKRSHRPLNMVGHTSSKRMRYWSWMPGVISSTRGLSQESTGDVPFVDGSTEFADRGSKSLDGGLIKSALASLFLHPETCTLPAPTRTQHEENVPDLAVAHWKIRRLKSARDPGGGRVRRRSFLVPLFRGVWKRGASQKLRS